MIRDPSLVLRMTALLSKECLRVVYPRAARAGARFQPAFQPRSSAAKVLAAFVFFLTAFARAAEVIPPAPDKFFNDYANVVRADTAHRLNEQLAQFERDTSNHIVVVVYPKLETDSSLEDYCYRVFHKWGVGQKKLDNGAVLFVFTGDRKLRIQTGYGLEGALPDAISKRIIEEEITPRFRQRDFDGGLTAGVNAMIAATRGEYKGSGRTTHEQRSGRPGASNNSGSGIPVLFALIIFAFIFFNSMTRRRGVMYNSRRRHYGGSTWFGTGGGWSSGGGSSWGGGGSSWGGGSSSDSGSSGFSGGGGDSGGGGASGSW